MLSVITSLDPDLANERTSSNPVDLADDDDNSGGGAREDLEAFDIIGDGVGVGVGEEEEEDETARSKGVERMVGDMKKGTRG